jgi:hypothetical protein
MYSNTAATANQFVEVILIVKANCNDSNYIRMFILVASS